MVGYHVTTEKKERRYVETGAILPPVRFWPSPETALRWARRVGRTRMLRFDVGESYPLPDHKPARWTPELVRKWEGGAALAPLAHAHELGGIQKKMIYLTSFIKSRYLPSYVKCYSAAVYQPRGYDFPEAEVFKIINSEGRWVRPRDFLDFVNPLDAYRGALMELYDGRRRRILRWLGEQERDIALLCWCPYERAARRQLARFGSFVCHLSVVGRWLWVNAGGAEVWSDSDRLNMAVLEQKTTGGTS